MDNNVFTVLPMSQTINLVAGETYTGKITIVNPADATADFAYKVETTPYGVAGLDYTADLATMTNRTQIAKWITIEEPTGTIKPNETKEVKYKIKVPENAPAGGQYAAITVTSADKGEADNGVAVKNVFEMASLVYANVAGETEHDGQILENSVPGFVVSQPVTVTTKFSNNGNVHEIATIKLEVKDMFSDAVILPTEENEGTYSELIMPETERLVTRDITNLPALGMVKVTQTVYYNGESSTTEQNVIICPIWFMAIVAATILAIVALVVRIILRHSKKKKASY